jgi:SpoVK/Ycf46/Vps4 family AAA+-type ATPase
MSRKLQVNSVRPIDEPATDSAVPSSSFDRLRAKLTEKADNMEEAQRLSSTTWAVVDGEKYFGCSQTTDTLPPGQYITNIDNSGNLFLKAKNTEFDEIIQLDDSASDSIIKEIEDFWNKEELFRKFNYLWKRGILMHGPPGSGKTSTLQLIVKKLIERGGIALYCIAPEYAAKGLQLIRSIEPDRPVIVILEDIDSIIDDHGETDVLSLLDGELQVDNVVFIATTNYPENLDGRLKNRPSRFDIVRYVGMPSDKAREQYIKHVLAKSGVELEEKEMNHWINKTAGMSVAHIKELIILVQIYSMSVEEAIDRLMEMISANPSSSDYSDCIGGQQKIGFCQ